MTMMMTRLTLAGIESFLINAGILRVNVDVESGHERRRYSFL